MAKRKKSKRRAKQEGVPQLLKLARRKFGKNADTPLGQTDEKLFADVAAGRLADFMIGNDEADNPACAALWANERVVKADRIEWLCSDTRARSLVTRRGIWIRGVRLVGQLELTDVECPWSLALLNCSLPEGAYLVGATFRSLALDGTHSSSIFGDRIHVKGQLSIRDGAVINGQCRFNGSRIGSQVRCTGSEFTNPDGEAFVLDSAHVGDSVFLDSGFRAEGIVRADGVKVTGQFVASGGQFVNPESVALVLDSAQIERDVLLDNGFEAKGHVRLIGATIGAQLLCTNGRFESPGSEALSFDKAVVERGVFLNEGFSANGTVKLGGATVRGQFIGDGGQFNGCGSPALVMDGVSVGLGIFLRHGFVANGEVRLLGATVDGQLCCSGGQFKNGQDEALSIDGATIRNALFINEGFFAEGTVRLNGATISGQVIIQHCEICNPGNRALALGNSKIGGYVFMDEGLQAKGSVDLIGAEFEGIVRFAVSSDVKLIADRMTSKQGFTLISDGEVEASFSGAMVTGPLGIWLGGEKRSSINLESTRVGSLEFRLEHWRNTTGRNSRTVQLRLSALQYDTLEILDSGGNKFEDRYEDWVRLQYNDADATPTFYPQPYEQLASVLRQHGREKEATDVLVAKNDDRAKYADMEKWSLRRHKALGHLIRYGYHPFHALWYALALVLLGWAVFYGCRRGEWMKELVDGKDKSGGAYSSLVYSIDCFVPIVDLGQRANFRPDARAGCELINIPVVSQWTGTFHSGGFFLIYYWIHIGLGWFLSTVFVSGLAGLIRR